MLKNSTWINCVDGLRNCQSMGSCIATLVSVSSTIKCRGMSKGKAAEEQSGRSALEAIDLCSSQESDEDAEHRLKRAAHETDANDPTTSLASAAGLKRSSSSADKEGDGVANASSSFKKRRHHDAGNTNGTLLQSLATRLYSETTRQTPDGATVTPGIVGLLRSIPTTDAANVRVCGLCTTSEPGRAIRQFLPLHYRQGDKWSCGYRNLQMVLSSLLPLLPASHPYFAETSSGNGGNGDTHSRMPPSTVLDIQLLLERAWKDGFDPEGAKHYQGKIRGKSKWIGAVEVASVLTSLSVDCAVIQFIKRDSSRRLLVDFVWQYFDSQSGFDVCQHARDDGGESGQGAYVSDLAQIILANCGHGAASGSTSTNGATAASRGDDGGTCISSSPLVPIYLQYPGHSITIVGIERVYHDGGANVSFNFLVIDPMKDGETIRKRLWDRKISGGGVGLPDIVRVSADWIRQKDTQIIVCGSSPLISSERMVRMGKNGIDDRLVITAGELS